MKPLFQFKNPPAFQASVVMLVLVMFLLFVIFTVTTFAQATFSPSTDFAAPFNATATALADVNGDGKQDMVITGPYTISVFLNTTTPNASTPTFTAKTDFTPGGFVWNTACADFNGDGKPDMAYTGGNPNSLVIYTNTTTTGASTPTFSSPTTVASPANQPWNIAVGDINGDGKPDIAVNYLGYSFVTVYLNTTTTGAATPTFSAGTDFAITSGGRSVALKDLNGDGKLDIAVTNNSSNTVSVFLNTTTTGAATPTFSARTDFATLNDPYTVQIADINMDGKQDLIVLLHNSSSISVLLNTTPTGNATPTFAAVQSFTAGDHPNVLTIGDLNNDGKPDLVICATNASGKLGVYLNNTTPGSSTAAFYTMSEFNTNGSPNQCSIVDFNGDGKPDIAAATANFVSVLMNTMTLGVASPSFSTRTGLVTTGAPQDVCSADFNGDGKPDFAITNYGSSVISIALNTTAPGAATPTFSSFTTFAANGTVIGIWSADFNGDGKPDIACINYGPSLISVYINTTTPGASTPTFTAKTDFAATNAANYLVAADFNGDGKPDLACTDMNNTSMSVLLNTTTPGSTTPSFTAKTTFAAGTAVMKILAADFNGDGKPDIVVSNKDANSISVYINTTTPGASTPTFTAKTDFAVNSTSYGLGIGDFNGDGKQDIACANGSAISVFLNTTTPGSTTPTFSAKTDFVTTKTASYMCTADFNGDGLVDLGYSNATGLTNYCSVYLNNTTPGSSTPVFNNKTDYVAGSGPMGVAASDFNLDGKKDLICADGNSGSISVFLNQANLPAPVELSSFTSSVDKQNVTLNWSTVSEENNRGFEIERNSFGAGWKTIGYVEGHGTSNQINNYSFTEHGMATGRYNYRLKQIDFNGNYKYYDLSNEVIIGIPQKFSLSQNYPNPFNPVSVINYQIPVSGFVSMKVFDISGREVASLVNHVKESGYYSVTFDAKNLSSGTYFYKLSTSDFSDTKKMVLVK